MDVVQPIKIAKDLDTTYSQMTERQRVQVMEALVSYMINNLNKSPANVKFFEVRRDKDSQKKLQALQAYNKTMTLAPNFQPQQLDLLQDLLLDLFSYQVKSGAVPQLVNMKKMVTDSKAAGETKVFSASAFEACFTLDSNAEMFRHVCRLLLKMQEKKKLAPYHYLAPVFADVFCSKHELENLGKIERCLIVVFRDMLEKK